MTPEEVLSTLSGRPPYLWQKDLLTGWLMAGRIPEALDVPTGLGKTSVMHAWLAARALAPAARLPRRLVYVVDRRAVVDQATEEAAKLRKTLGNGEGDVEPRIAELRERLGLRFKQWLPVSTLRGQLADNREWLEDPSAPAIIVGTVDMIGSRLLYSGYGVSRRMRPVHAGLLGSDALIVLDEAHLVPPFEALIKQVIAQRARESKEVRDVVPALRLMSLSATGRGDASDDVFRLSPEHQVDSSVRKRLEAVKRLRVLDEATGKDALATRLAERASELAADKGAVLVFCNSRQTAQKVLELLPKPSVKSPNVPPIALLVGERRVLERSLLATDPAYRCFLPDPALRAQGPAILIATSAGEVGVDLDADHMVCDLVTWERMVQRLGRVNRRAEPGEAIVEVVPALPDTKDEETETPIADKERLAVLRRAVEQLPAPEEEPGVHDASPGAILRLRADPRAAEMLQAATSGEPLRPALTTAVVEAWAMTSLEHHPGRPNVAPWIRGWVEETPQARVLWRRVFPVPEDFKPDVEVRAVLEVRWRKLLNGFFEAAPPHLTETLEAPTFRVVDVLKKRVEAWFKERRADKAGSHAARSPIVVVLDTAGEVEDLLGAERLKETDSKELIRRFTGRTLVIDARLGGLDEGGLLDAKANETPPTWDGEIVAESERGWSEARLKVVGRRLWTKRADAKAEKDWVREAGWPLIKGDADDDDDVAQELRVERLKVVPSAGDAARSTPQALDDHHRWTGEDALRIATAVFDDEPCRRMLVASAEAHDLGKNRAQWQNAMGADRDGRPWAKTSGRRADQALLEGYRHEFGSLRDGEKQLRDEIADPNLQDLALHLIAAHHGHARPTIRAHDPDEAPSTSERRAREVALRYARLQRRWGPWGLAWWEALLRAADWSASRRIGETEEPG